MPLHRGFWALCFSTLLAIPAGASTVLFDFAVNVDGYVAYCDIGPNPAPPCTGAPLAADLAALAGTVDTSGFDFSTGLGAISITIVGGGARYVSLFVDHEIHETDNTYFNEFGEVTGTADIVQTYELDDPVYGDIIDNFFVLPLDDTNAVAVDLLDPFIPPCSNPCLDYDVAMALGWDVTLAAGQRITIAFLLSDGASTSGFYLTHGDDESADEIYFSSSVVPLPAAAWLFLSGLGLIGAVKARRRKVS